jgi:hypothetical protein
LAYASNTPCPVTDHVARRTAFSFTNLRSNTAAAPSVGAFSSGETNVAAAATAAARNALKQHIHLIATVPLLVF